VKIVDQEFDEAIDVSSITEHPDNPRRGDDNAVVDSIEHNGFFGGILVQRSTGFVIAGNTRYRAALVSGAESVPGFWLNIDDDEAKRIMLIDNRASDLAIYDDDVLLGVLAELHNGTGLAGTGYDEATYELLLNLREGADLDDLEPPESFPTIDPDNIETQFRCPSCSYEWAGSPRPGQPTHEPEPAND